LLCVYARTLKNIRLTIKPLSASHHSGAFKFITMERTCKKCGETKPIEEYLVYHRTAGFPDIDNNCRRCKREYHNYYYHSNSQKVMVCNLKSRKKNMNLYRYKANKRARERTKNLTNDYVMQCLINKTGINRDILKKHIDLIQIERMRIKILRLTK
jgi:hypothetical protein